MIRQIRVRQTGRRQSDALSHQPHCRLGSRQTNIRTATSCEKDATRIPISFTRSFAGMTLGNYSIALKPKLLQLNRAAHGCDGRQRS